jgi:hypothetical protein
LEQKRERRECHILEVEENERTANIMMNRPIGINVVIHAGTRKPGKDTLNAENRDLESCFREIRSRQVFLALR